jgi:hypothetical protein
MANKNDNYYLLNGDEVESTAIYLPYKGKYIKNSKDISDIDLASIELGTSFRESLQEANPKLKLGNQYYLGKYPYSKGIKIFKPVEVFEESDKTQRLVDSFREISEERNYNYYKGNSLESGNKDKILRLVYSILENLSNLQKMKMFNSSSILGKDTKSNYYNNKHLFEEQISNYTQLRNMLINYLYIKANKSLPYTKKLVMVSESLDSIQGLYPEEPDTITKALKEYKEALIKAKDEEDKKQAFEEYTQMTRNPYIQMTLFDVFQTEDLSFLNKNKK